MNDQKTLPEIEKWVRQAVLRIQLLALNNDSAYPSQSVRYILLRIFEILAGKRMNADIEEYTVNEIFQVLGLKESKETILLRQILLDGHHRAPTLEEIVKAVDVLNLPTLPSKPEPSVFLLEVFRFCWQTDYLSSSNPSS